MPLFPSAPLFASVALASRRWQRMRPPRIHPAAPVVHAFNTVTKEFA
jgi:hypothetical protein